LRSYGDDRAQTGHVPIQSIATFAFDSRRSQGSGKAVSVESSTGEIRMTRPPNRYRPTDALSVAEAVFKPATPVAAESVRVKRKGGVPVSKESVSIKLDSDLIAHFQEDGPGWQERINDTLRRATGL
jgi:uncharacterized protein (DUF4415 family)